MIATVIARRGHHADLPERRVNIVRGEQHVTDDAGLCVTTLLGSCVAACLADLEAGVGGMNHFLLPGADGEGRGMQYGVHAMELLVNALLQRGARRERLQAKLFGGARMVQGLTDVGAQNAQFATRFVQREHIALGHADLDCDLDYVSGRARQQTMGRDAQLFTAERDVPPLPDTGGVELF